jgi:antitoxin (DNA-binding transcriptional repressor) of toxin-antitoxin stability system
MKVAGFQSRLKAKALEYFRQVETTGQPLVITDRGRAVLRLEPFRPDPEAALEALRGTVKRYVDPTGPVEVESWEALG